MASVHKLPQRIMVFTTPQELRDLADKMEVAWSVAKLGEILTVETWASRDAEVVFSIMQESMPNPVGTMPPDREWVDATTQADRGKGIKKELNIWTREERWTGKKLPGGT